MLLPRLKKSRMDKLDPILHIPKTESVDPSLVTPLREKLEPHWNMSRTDNVDPRRPRPYTDRLEPKRQCLRVLMLLPSWR
jgi:hypothetical protein